MPPVLRPPSSVLSPDTEHWDMIIEPHRHLLDLKLGDLWRYRDLDWAEIKEILGNPLLLDGRNFLDRHELERLGYRYVGVGR